MKSGGTFHARALLARRHEIKLIMHGSPWSMRLFSAFKSIALFHLQVSSVVRLQLTSHCFSFERNQPLLSSLSPIKVIKDKLMSK